MFRWHHFTWWSVFEAYFILIGWLCYADAATALRMIVKRQSFPLKYNESVLVFNCHV